MAYINRTRVIETIRAQHCTCRVEVGGEDCRECPTQHCIDAIKLMPEENVWPVNGEAHRLWNFAEYGTTYVCSACHSQILHANQSYCAFCGRKLSKEVEQA